MSILNLNGPAGGPARGKRAVKVWMGIGLVIAVLGVGSTLASTITINSGQNTEFGQGVQRTVYCGGNKEISVKPISSYVNNIETSTSLNEDSLSHHDVLAQSSPGSFYLSGIKVSEIPEECSGVDFVLSVYPADGSSPVILASTGNEGVDLTYPTVYWARVSGGDIAELSATRDRFTDPSPMASETLDNSGSFTLNFVGMYAHMDINDIGRILIETQDDVISEDFRSLGLMPVRGTRSRS